LKGKKADIKSKSRTNKVGPPEIGSPEIQIFENKSKENT
jgi:hypothetical protein